MKYSILIPCYKQETLVGPCLDSVVAQKVHDWEAICTDDGSPDRTGEILDEYVKNHCQDVRSYFCEQEGEKKRILEGRCPLGGVIKILHQANKGLSGARNAAKLLSCGEWYINLDGDDLLSPFALEIMERCLAKCPDADMIRGRFVRFSDGKMPDWGSQGCSVTIIDAAGPIRGGVAPSAFQAMVVHKRICGDIILDGANWSEERLYTARCLARINKVAVAEDGFYGYREHSGQFTRHGMKLEECKSYLSTSKDILDLFLQSGRGVAPEVVRDLLLHMIEWTPRFIVDFVAQKDRAAAWCYWFSFLPRLLQYKQLSVWMKFVVRTCIALPWIPIAYVFCYLPDWLKCHGIHR